MRAIADRRFTLLVLLVLGAALMAGAPTTLARHRSRQTAYHSVLTTENSRPIWTVSPGAPTLTWSLRNLGLMGRLSAFLQRKSATSNESTQVALLGPGGPAQTLEVAALLAAVTKDSDLTVVEGARRVLKASMRLKRYAVDENAIKAYNEDPTNGRLVASAVVGFLRSKVDAATIAAKCGEYVIDRQRLTEAVRISAYLRRFQGIANYGTSAVDAVVATHSLQHAYRQIDLERAGALLARVVAAAKRDGGRCFFAPGDVFGALFSSNSPDYGEKVNRLAEDTQRVSETVEKLIHANGVTSKVTYHEQEETFEIAR